LTCSFFYGVVGFIFGVLLILLVLLFEWFVCVFVSCLFVCVLGLVRVAWGVVFSVSFVLCGVGLCYLHLCTFVCAGVVVELFGS